MPDLNAGIIRENGEDRGKKDVGIERGKSHSLKQDETQGKRECGNASSEIEARF
jgi:hypothetical protein